MDIAKALDDLKDAELIKMIVINKKVYYSINDDNVFKNKRQNRPRW